MKDSVVVGLRCLLFCRKLVKRENIVTENIIKNHNMFSKNEFRQFIYEFRHFRKFCNKYDIIQIQMMKKKIQSYCSLYDEVTGIFLLNYKKNYGEIYYYEKSK